MINIIVRSRIRIAQVFTDGAVHPQSAASGIGVILRDEGDRLRGVWSERRGVMTNNEAEYLAALLALEKIYPLHPEMVMLFSDSEVMVQQMGGFSRVRAASLINIHDQLCKMAKGFEKVTFMFIPRQCNRLADALASDAADGLGIRSQKIFMKPQRNGWDLVRTCQFLFTDKRKQEEIEC